MRKSVIDVNQKVIFIETLCKDSPKIGWVVANDAKHLDMHPYIVTVTINIPKIENSNPRASILEDPNLHFVHENNIRLFSENEYKKVVKYNIRISKDNSHNMNVYRYNVYCLSKKIIFPELYRTKRQINKIVISLKGVLSFIFNVILKGTLWLIFGNIIKLYGNQYRKYKIQNKIRDHKKNMDPSAFYYCGEGPLTHDDEILSDLNNQLEKASSEVETSSLNLITLLVAIISVLLSIIL